MFESDINHCRGEAAFALYKYTVHHIFWFQLSVCPVKGPAIWLSDPALFDWLGRNARGQLRETRLSLLA
jgi:hypothetical protein